MEQGRLHRKKMDEATHKLNFKPLNIRDLFMDKNPRLARLIPGFMYRLLSRILRIDFMNDPILYNHGYKKDVDFARASMEAFNVTLEVFGRAHLPKEGRFIFVANHPLGGFDGMMIISELSRNYPHLKVLVNDLLTNVKNMDGIFVPNESYKHRHKHFVITFSKPIPFSTFDKRYTPVEWAALVKDYTYSLVENPEGVFSHLKPYVVDHEHEGYYTPGSS